MKCDYCPNLALHYITFGYYESHGERLGEYHICDQRVCEQHRETLQNATGKPAIYHSIAQLIDYEKLCRWCKRCQQPPGKKHCHYCAEELLRQNGEW